jgi:hypothetical protein
MPAGLKIRPGILHWIHGFTRRKDMWLVHAKTQRKKSWIYLVTKALSVNALRLGAPLRLCGKTAALWETVAPLRIRCAIA